MTNPIEQFFVSDNERIKELEREVETWKAAYRKAIRHDQRVITQLMERHYEHG